MLSYRSRLQPILSIIDLNEATPCKQTEQKMGFTRL